MKRPGVAEKKLVDPDLEPDFYKISELLPVPGTADEESIFLQKTLQSGPKSRMPIITGHFKTSSTSNQLASDTVSVSSSEDTASAPTSVSPPSPHMMSHPTPSFDFSTMPAIGESNVTPEGQVRDTPVANPLLFQMPIPTMDGKDSAASSSFAAGFAAATAHYHQHFYNMMSKMAANGQMPEAFNPGNMAA